MLSRTENVQSEVRLPSCRDRFHLILSDFEMYLLKVVSLESGLWDPEWVGTGNPSSYNLQTQYFWLPVKKKYQ